MSSANRRLRATLCHTAATRSYAGASDSGEQAADIAKALELVRSPEVREAVRLEQRLHERELNYRLRRDQLQQVLAAAETVHEQKQASTVLDCTERIHTQGFAVLPLLDAERLAALRDGMAPVFHGVARAHARKFGTTAQGELEAGVANPGDINYHRSVPHTANIANVLAKTRAADNVAADPLLRAVIAGVLGSDSFQLSCCHAKCPSPGCGQQGLHRDDGAPGLFELPGGMPGDPGPHRPVVCNTLLAIDDFTAETGATRLIPGSQAWPRSRKPREDDTERLVMPAGSIMIFDGQLYHAACANTTEKTLRRTLCLNYIPDWCRPIDNHFLSIGRQTILDMPPELSGDLGYRESSRNLGTPDDQNPLDYLRRLLVRGDGSQGSMGFDTSDEDAAAEAELARRD